MNKYVVVMCEHSEKTEVPVLCGTFDTRTKAENFIESEINKSLDEFKDEKRLDDIGVAIYDENGVITYSCVWTTLKVEV